MEERLTPEQEAAVEALGADLFVQGERAGVDLQEALPRLREIAPPAERRISEDTVEVTHAIDLSGIVEVLRGLPDGAGTDAFVAAYDARVDQRSEP
jgi:hypothetical protein